MTPFLQGFASELVKVGGALGALGGAGKFLVKHPLMGLGALTVAGTTGAAMLRGAQGGLGAGEEGRYLQATKHGPSQAAYTNYHPLFEHKPSRAQTLRLHENYRPGAFRR